MLLENAQYIDCARCLENINQKRRLLNADCPDCHAWGVLPNPRYCEAAARAGLPIPPTAEAAGIVRLEETMANIVRARRDS